MFFKKVVKVIIISNFQRNFLKKFNFGKPEIRNINLVSKLNNNIKTNGNEVIRCIIR